MVEVRRLVVSCVVVEVRVFEVGGPIGLLGANREFEIFLRDGIPVL